MTVKPLKALRTEFDGCEIAILVDISTGIVLASDGALKWPQEKLDTLCQLATQVMAIGSDATAVHEMQTAMLVRATGVHTFVRAAPGANEILCGVFAPGSDLDGVFEACVPLCADLLLAGEKARASNER